MEVDAELAREVWLAALPVELEPVPEALAPAVLLCVPPEPALQPSAAKVTQMALRCRTGTLYCKSRVDDVVKVPAPVLGSTTVPAVCTVMTHPVALSVAVPLWKVHCPLALSTQVDPATTVALAGPVSVKGSTQLGSSVEPKASNSTPPSVATTIAESGPEPPPPEPPNSSETEVVPLQVPGSSGVPPSRGQGVPPLLLPEAPEDPPELELPLPPQVQLQSQPPVSQVSAATQGGWQAPQLFGPQLALVELPPEACELPEPFAHAHCQLPPTQ